MRMCVVAAALLIAMPAWGQERNGGLTPAQNEMMEAAFSARDALLASFCGLRKPEWFEAVRQSTTRQALALISARAGEVASGADRIGASFYAEGVFHQATAGAHSEFLRYGQATCATVNDAKVLLPLDNMAAAAGYR